MTSLPDRRTNPRRRLAIAALLTGLACDPGWRYVVPSGTPGKGDGVGYVVRGPERTGVRVWGSLFTNSLTTELELTNEGGEPLTADWAALAAYDVQGRSLVRAPSSEWARCPGRPAVVAELAPREICRVVVHWRVLPDPVALRTVRLVHGGLARGGRKLNLEIVLEMER
jgi:hypothetical protein